MAADDEDRWGRRGGGSGETEAHREGLLTVAQPRRRSMMAVAGPVGARGGGAHEGADGSMDGSSRSSSWWPSGAGSRSVE
jgi:hypothetical protein